MTTLRVLTELGVGFVSLTETLDLATPIGRVMAGLLAVFGEFEREILGERVPGSPRREEKAVVTAARGRPR